jgi:hypothetical protein
MTTYRYDDLRPRLGVIQNRMTTPNSEGGECWKAWEHFARCYGQGVTTRKGILEHMGARKLNKGNLGTELPRWKQFYGIK